MAWTGKLTAAGVPEAVQKWMVDKGYDSEEVFCSAFTDAAALDGWLKRAQPALEAYKNLSAEEWLTHPVAAKIRIVWKGAGSGPAGPVTTGPAAVSSALSVSVSKLGTGDRERMRKEVEKQYPSHVFQPDTLPSMTFLQCIHAQCIGKNWEWVPWRRVLSDAASLEVKAQRVSTDMNLMHLVAESMGIPKEEHAAELPCSAFKIQCLLETRGNAYAMCKAARLGSWALYSAKFMGYYTKKPPAFQRGPNGAEAEEADRTCLAEVFDLCFNGATMDNALHQVVVERDMLRSLLGPQPKAWKAEKADASQTKGKGKGKKRHEPDERSLPPVKRVRNGECWRWLEGKCKEGAKCRFRHDAHPEHGDKQSKVQ